MKNFFNVIKETTIDIISGYLHIIILFVFLPLGYWSAYLFHRSTGINLMCVDYGFLLFLTYIWYLLAYYFVLIKVATSIKDRQSRKKNNE
jgi:hypothetical protein